MSSSLSSSSSSPSSSTTTTTTTTAACHQEMMMMQVRWRHHQSGLLTYLRQMLASELFVDVTLCCQGKRLKAHRVLLSASSPYLQALLLAHPSNEHTTIILHDILYEDMRSLLDFIYTGGVTLKEERLTSFLSAAEALNITVLIDKQLYRTIPANTPSLDDWSASLPYPKTVPPLIKMDQISNMNRWSKNGGNTSNNNEWTKNGSQHDELKYNPVNPGPDYLHNINDMKPFLDIKSIAFDSSRCSSFSDSSEDSQRRSIDSGLEVLNSPSYYSDNKPDIKTKQEDVRVIGNGYFYHHLSPNHLPHHQIQDKDDKRFIQHHHQTDIDHQNQWLRPLPSLMPIVNNNTNSPSPNLSPIMIPNSIYPQKSSARYASRTHSLGGILMPSPWSQNGRPPVGLPTNRRPIINEEPKLSTSEIIPITTHLSEPKTLIDTQEVNDLSTTKKKSSREQDGGGREIDEDTNHVVELSTKKVPKIEHDDEINNTSKTTSSTDYKNENIIKLCKLKERRLKEFYREQKLSQSSTDLMEFPKNYKGDDHKKEVLPISPTFKINLKSHQKLISNNTPEHDNNKTDTTIKSITPELLIKKDNWTYEKPEINLVNESKLLVNNGINESNKTFIIPGLYSNHSQDSSTVVTLNDNNNNQHLNPLDKPPEDVSKTLKTTKENCEDCNIECLSKSELMEHNIKVHSLTKILNNFLCTICNKNFNLKSQLTSHQKIHHDNKNPEHSCSHCGKAFLTKASLKVHLRTHTGEKPFHCNECGKQFSQLRNYKYHRSVHEGTKEFAATCPECGKYFNDRGYLSSHMKIHRNRKEYGCEYCGKCFNQRVAYNMHVRIHTGVKPHVCQHCSKSFSRKMLLKQHLRIHTGEKPFKCMVCQKAFADRSNMTLHMRLHSGIKPYQCNVCSKSFTKKHHLKTHMNYHTGVKPYACSKCGLRFSQSSNMRTHFKKCTSSSSIASSSTTSSSHNMQDSQQQNATFNNINNDSQVHST